MLSTYHHQKTKTATNEQIDRRDGVVVRASASQSVYLGFISLVESYRKTLKLVSIASLFGAQHLWEVMENKPASSLVVSLARHLTGRPTFMSKTGDPEMATPSECGHSVKNIAIHCFLVNG